MVKMVWLNITATALLLSLYVNGWIPQTVQQKNNTTGLKSKVPVFFVFFYMQHMVCLTEEQPEDQGQ